MTVPLLPPTGINQNADDVEMTIELLLTVPTEARDVCPHRRIESFASGSA